MLFSYILDDTMVKAFEMTILIISIIFFISLDNFSVLTFLARNEKENLIINKENVMVTTERSSFVLCYSIKPILRCAQYVFCSLLPWLVCVLVKNFYDSFFFLSQWTVVFLVLCGALKKICVILFSLHC